MRLILIVVGVLALLFGAVAITQGPSDIQLGIGVNAMLAAFILFGLSAVLSRMNKQRD
jgi:uncharacterized membrane protein